MRAKSHRFELIASDALSRILEIVENFVDVELPRQGAGRYRLELKHHEQTLKLAFEYRKKEGPERNLADSDVYFSEKLGSLLSFANMAIEPSIRGGYTSAKITENSIHFAYLVSKLVASNIVAPPSRRKSFQVIRENSELYSEALKRLADR